MELESISVKNAFDMLQEYIRINESQQQEAQQSNEIARNRQRRGLKPASRKSNKDDVNNFYN